MNRRSWTKREERQLRELYPINSTKDLCELFNRTDKAIRSRAKLLGLVKGPEALDASGGLIPG